MQPCLWRARASNQHACNSQHMTEEAGAQPHVRGMQILLGPRQDKCAAIFASPAASRLRFTSMAIRIGMRIRPVHLHTRSAIGLRHLMPAATSHHITMGLVKPASAEAAQKKVMASGG